MAWYIAVTIKKGSRGGDDEGGDGNEVDNGENRYYNNNDII